jgi:putative transposase
LQAPSETPHCFSYQQVSHSLVHLLPKAELLNKEVFESLAHVRQALGRWRYDYHNTRPHSALDGLTPATVRRALELLDRSAPSALAKPQQIKYSAAGLSF